jgi:hypothetical protein
MKLRIIGFSAASITLAAYIGACGVAQPKPGCPIASGPFAAKYTKVSGTGGCSELPGEMIGFEQYTVPGAKETKIAVRPYGLGARFIDDTNGEQPQVPTGDEKGVNLNAIGKFPQVPGADDFCVASDLSVAKADFEKADETLLADGGVDLPEIPATSIAYEFTDLKVLVTPEAPGTQFTANVKYTQDGCTATYSAIGMWPAHGCGSDDDCDPLPNLDAGRVTGSGINPSFPVKCDMDLGMCMITKPPPALNK